MLGHPSQAYEAIFALHVVDSTLHDLKDQNCVSDKMKSQLRSVLVALEGYGWKTLNERIPGQHLNFLCSLGLITVEPGIHPKGFDV